jgi:thioesterase domain-containing protein
MPAFKDPGFQQRQEAAARAKSASLAKYRSRPPIDEAVMAERTARRIAREAAEAEKRAAARRAKEEAAEAKQEQERLAAAAADAAAKAQAEAAAPSRVRVPAPYANRHRYIARWPATTAADMKALIRPLSYVDPTTDSQLAKGRLPVDHHELTSAFGTAVQARK